MQKCRSKSGECGKMPCSCYFWDLQLVPQLMFPWFYFRSHKHGMSTSKRTVLMVSFVSQYHTKPPLRSPGFGNPPLFTGTVWRDTRKCLKIFKAIPLSPKSRGDHSVFDKYESAHTEVTPYEVTDFWVMRIKLHFQCWALYNLWSKAYTFRLTILDQVIHIFYIL